MIIMFWGWRGGGPDVRKTPQIFLKNKFEVLKGHNGTVTLKKLCCYSGFGGGFVFLILLFIIPPPGFKKKNHFFYLIFLGKKNWAFLAISFIFGS